jgi:hypothetical protein
MWISQAMGLVAECLAKTIYGFHDLYALKFSAPYLDRLLVDGGGK